MRAPITGPSFGSDLSLSGNELAAAVGISPMQLARLVRMGLVEPAAPAPREFTPATAARLSRMLRLHRDLGVNLIGAAIIADLMERLNRLESELGRLPSGP